MTWSEITENWPVASQRLGKRFPRLRRDALAFPPQSISELTRHIAATHDLTSREADEELENWVLLETQLHPRGRRTLR